MRYVCCMIEFVYSVKSKTSRDRYKLAPYLKLKNSRRRQSVKYSFAVPGSFEYSFTAQKLGQIGALKGGPFRIF